MILKGETLKYLEKDLISLYQVVEKMSDIVFSNYRVNITDVITISYLAIGIYRSNFMSRAVELNYSTGAMENAIRSAYFGGRTEVFKPKGDNLFYYDYNGLYSSAMLNQCLWDRHYIL